MTAYDRRTQLRNIASKDPVPESTSAGPTYRRANERLFWNPFLKGALMFKSGAGATRMAGDPIRPGSRVRWEFCTFEHVRLSKFEV